MRRVWGTVIVLVVGLMFLPAVIGAQGTPDLLPDRSVGVLSADPGYGERWSTTIFPFGNYTGTVSGRAIFCRTYLHFPVTVQADAQVDRATLYVYVDDFWPGPGGAPMSVYPLSGDWTVEGVNWNEMGAWPPLEAPVATTAVNAAPGWFAWDVTALMQAWVSGARPNYGLAIAAADLNAVSDNWAAARRLTADSPDTRPYLAYAITVLATATPETPAPTPVPTTPPPTTAPTASPPSEPTTPAAPTPTPQPVLLPATGERGRPSPLDAAWGLLTLSLGLPILGGMAYGWMRRRR